MRRVVVIGSTGQLAQDLLKAWGQRWPSDDLVGLSHQEIEITSPASTRQALEHHKPHIVVNTAAYHRVDDAEENLELTFAVNATAVGRLARLCAELDAILMHVSTDYVYSDGGGVPIPETAPVDPSNAYGTAKAAGEMLLRARAPKHFIVRSSGLYGIAGSARKGGNFVETMLRLAAADRPFRVVDDQLLTPTPTHLLAAQMVELVATDAYGTYHATCQGECSWYDFAQEIFRQTGACPPITPQSTAESGATAARPAYSVLDNHRLRLLGLDIMPHWQDALASYLAARTAHSSHLDHASSRGLPAAEPSKRTGAG